MKILKRVWLEILFFVLILIILVLSSKNLVHDIKIDYGKRMGQSEIQMDDVGMETYIEEIKRLGDCTAIFSVKDIQGYCVTQQIIDGLKSLGFDQADTLMEQEYHSFIGIWDSGAAVYQYVGGDEMITYGKQVDKHYIFARSATWAAGNIAEIYIDDVSYAVNNRGYNIVVLDKEHDKIIDSVAYDTYLEDIPVYRLINEKVTFIKATKGIENE